MKLGVCLFLLVFAVEAGAGVIISDEFKWPTSTIPVCWKDSRGLHFDGASRIKSELLPKYVGLSWASFARIKEEIRKVVQEEYLQNRLGVEFEGWEDCRRFDTSAVWISLYTRTDSRNEANIPIAGRSTLIGTRHSTSENHQTKNVAIVFRTRELLQNYEFNLDLKRQLRLAALHEFSHVAGLMHERNFELKERVTVDGFPFQVIGERNPESIMDDSVLKHEEARLAESDVLALRCLYLYEGQEKEERCGLNSGVLEVNPTLQYPYR